ncbi:MAG: DUF362 domain-containing protein, partial [Bacteroidetes bacterium]|nr:DUF362 domain-containing protein [Bacteroidota bacterium]
LEEALEKADFWEIIQEAWKSSKLAQKKFLILIKPDLNMFDIHSTTGTDPELVEHLIDLLCQKGFANIMVADSPGDADLWLENRDVLILADLLGYKFETPGQQPYDIVNLSENLIDDVFPKGDPLVGEEISEHWVKANFTINFAKNKSDEANLFSLCLNNLIHILPLRAKTYHYQHRFDPGEVATSLLTYVSADFNIIDAFISNHGSQGSRHSRPLETRTMIAGNHVLLCDWVGALKMGLDPYASNIHGAALKKSGLPENYQIKGDLNVYQGWEKISPFLRDSVLKRNSIPAIQKLSQPWLQEVNTEYFPFKQVYDEQINGIITPLIKDIDDHPVAHWMMIAINYLLVSISKAQKAWQVMYNKDQLYRKEVGLGVDLEKFADEDFEAVENYVRPFIQILQHTEPDRNGIKWRYIDESVLFEFSKILPVPYEDFIEKVEISQAVQMMYDNIGGLVVPVKKNQKGRVIHQAERDIYLPQPNWMILFDGKFIDVGKIECLKYKPDQREIWWRTVQSQNDSADFDDGMVRFAKDPGGTKITIIARQKFALPTFWKVVNMNFF